MFEGTRSGLARRVAAALLGDASTVSLQETLRMRAVKKIVVPAFLMSMGVLVMAFPSDDSVLKDLLPRLAADIGRLKVVAARERL